MSDQDYSLSVEEREAVGKKTRALRRSGLLPAALYGYGVEPTKVQLPAREFEAVYRHAGSTSLVDLKLGSRKPVKVFVHEVQRHPISRDVLHVDFLAVNLRQEVTTEVPVVLVGESPAVESNLGVLLRELETVTVRALPQDLPHQIEVPAERLAEVEDEITVGDLPTDGNYEILSDPAGLVAKIVPQRMELEEEEVAAEEAEEGGEEAEGAEAPSEGEES